MRRVACSTILVAAAGLTACRTLPGDGTAERPGTWRLVQGTCGIDDAGRAWCLGWDPAAELLPATPIVRGRTFVTVAGSLHQGCALDRNGTAWCWGPQLLTGVRLPPSESCGGPWQRPCELVPTPVSTALRFTALDVSGSDGRSACGVTADGAAWCWGNADSGRLGGAVTDSVCRPYGCFAPPTRVASAVAFRDIAVGGTHACGLTASGEAWCWGGNAHRQLGERTTERCRDGHLEGDCSPTPLRVRGGHRFTSISLGAVHGCGLTTDGRVLCWGSNIMGQLGTERQLDTCPVGHMAAPCTADPVPLSGTVGFRSVGAHHQFSCALSTAGAAWCWGEGDSGQLGQGSIERVAPWGTRYAPVRVTGGHRFTELFVRLPVCGRRADGDILCWGVRSPARDIAAPTRIPPPPPPVLAAFTPRAATALQPLAATVRDGVMHLSGGAAAMCANHAFHAGAAVSGPVVDLHVIAERWFGGGCDPTDAVFAWDATLALSPGTWRVRVVHRYHDDRGDVTRTPAEITVQVPG